MKMSCDCFQAAWGWIGQVFTLVNVAVTGKNDDWSVSHFVTIAFLQRFDGNKKLQLEVPTSKASVTLQKFHSRLEENIEVYFVHYLLWHKLRKDSTNTCEVTWGAMDTGSSHFQSSMDTYTFGLGRWKQQLGHLRNSLWHRSGCISTHVALTGLKRAIVSNFRSGC